MSVDEMESAAIINFNYDYYFLRDLFPKNKIITVINDDFVAQAKLNRGRHVARSLEITCKSSDAVFVVSYPLADQVSRWCTPQLFFPWAPSSYIKPRLGRKRAVALVWAHVDRRIDFSLLKAASERYNKLTYHVFGPVSKDVKSEVDKLKAASANVIFGDQIALEDMDWDQYFCALIPYRADVGDIKAVTISNKTFQLLSRGMPVVTHGMPHFLVNPAIVKTGDSESFLSGIARCRLDFHRLQDDIKQLVKENQSSARYEQVMRVVTGTPLGSTDVR
jgi:hypothetical protein